MKKEEFKKMYETQTNKEIADKLGVSAHTVINYAKRFSLQLKGKGYFGNKNERTKIKFEV
jgi:transposase